MTPDEDRRESSAQQPSRPDEGGLPQEEDEEDRLGDKSSAGDEGKERDQTPEGRDLHGLGQEGDSDSQEGIAEHQGGGIPGAIGGGQSGQGGG